MKATLIRISLEIAVAASLSLVGAGQYAPGKTSEHDGDSKTAREQKSPSSKKAKGSGDARTAAAVPGKR
jgi:hypothetical protein